MSDKTIPVLIVSLLSTLSSKRKIQLGIITLVMFIASLSEVVSIGAVLPFLSVLIEPEIVYNHKIGKYFVGYLGIDKPSDLIFPVTVTFGALVLCAGIIRIAALYASTRLSFAIGADLSFNIFKRTLYQPYAVHCKRNSSEIINGVFNKTNIVINSVVVSSVLILNSTIMLITIMSALIFVEPIIALCTFGGFGLIYVSIIGLTKRRLSLNSKREAFESTQVIKSLQEGLGGIRDVLIDGTQDFFCNLFRSSDLPLRQAQGTNLFIGTFPRFGVETFGTIFICILATVLINKSGSVETAIPILGLLALGAQRLLPILQQAYLSWTQIRSAKVSLEETILLLNQPMTDKMIKKNLAEIEFKRDIELKNVSFKHLDNENFILQKFSFKIKKGSRIGIVGATGSGKSTLADIIMGLHNPTKGALKIDGVTIDDTNKSQWQRHIAHVPQAIYLADSSVNENIAFGVPKEKIDEVRVVSSAAQAQIDKTINELPQKYKTFVGERGIRLSGGQRQRIGIARALYRNANVIIFDEATSALDNETEKAVMSAIENLNRDLTLIIIAHRISTLRNCDYIIELSNGSLSRVAKYHEL